MFYSHLYDFILCLTLASNREGRFQIFVTMNYQLLLHIKAIIKAFAAFYTFKEYIQSETNVNRFYVKKQLY